VPPFDSKHFQLDTVETSEIAEYFRNALWGRKLYLLKKGAETLPRARRHYMR
jgi:hypothetical protein